MRLTVTALLTLALAAPAAAQARRPAQPPQAPPLPPAEKYSFRPFFVLSGQYFSASTTFNAAFGSAFQPFWGGGLELVYKGSWFVDATATRFSKTGQRSFLFNGTTFPLGISLTATEVAFEATAGRRFRLRRHRTMTPYVGAGVGLYSYNEQSQFNDPSENLDVTHAGFVVVGGVAFRFAKYVELSGDGQYTYVPGILGTGGVSQQAGENNLGGLAARVRVIVGK